MMVSARTEESLVDRLNRVTVWGGVVLVPISLVLGYVGYRSLGSGSLSVADAAFGSIQLFVLEAPTDLTKPPLALNVARFTAPLSLALATVAALLGLLGQQLRRVSLRWRGRGLVVIVGLSESSADLLRSLRQQRTTVAVLESDSSHPLLPAALDRGAITFAGDGRHPQLLRKCRVDVASHVIVTTGDDSINLEVCEQLASLISGGTTVHAAIRDEQLWSSLGRIEIEQQRDGAAFEFFNPPDRKALTFVDHVHSMLGPAVPEDIIFVGDGELARQVLLRWSQRRLIDGGGLRLHVSQATEAEVIRPLLAEKPWLTPLIDVLVESASLAPALVLVCSERSDGRALSSALTLAAEPHVDQVFVCSTRYEGRVLDLKGLSSKIRIVPAGAAFLRPATFFSQSWTEIMARARHEDYCANERSRGITLEGNASLVHWGELPESLRDSNRRFAVSVGRVLGKPGLGWRP